MSLVGAQCVRLTRRVSGRGSAELRGSKDVDVVSVRKARRCDRGKSGVVRRVIATGLR